MKAHELAELLMATPDADVLFTYNYGDYWRTTVAARIDSVEIGKVVHSDYHSMDKVVEPNEDTEEYPAGAREVVLLG